MPSEPSFHTKVQSLFLTINLDIYSLDAIKKTCYKFSDRCSIFLDEVNNDAQTIKVIFTLTQDKPNIDGEGLLNEFKNELLDQDLRERISSETEAIRNLILAQAFSKTSLLDE